MTSKFMEDTGVTIPLICGAMYPCSNVELMEAVVGAGALAVVQPLSTVFAHRQDLRETIRKIAAANQGGCVGFNALIEKSSKVYEDRMRKWVDIALEEGVKFFVSALGNPSWVVEKAHAAGAVVYHDVTERKWAEKALEGGVDGLICVNGRAGGHAGSKSPIELYESLADLGVPLVAAGGVGSPAQFLELLDIGYEAVQMGTRFIATKECTAHEDYKKAILKAAEEDIVLTRRISGVPVSVIKTPFVERVGTEVGPITERLLKHHKAKHWVRSYFAAKSVFKLGRNATKGGGYNDYWQAGRSVDGIKEIQPAAEIVAEFQAALAERAA